MNWESKKQPIIPNQLSQYILTSNTYMSLASQKDVKTTYLDEK